MPLTSMDQNSLNASPSLQRAEITIKYRKLNPYTTGEINVLLLENISPNAVEIFKRAGFNVRRFRMKNCLIVSGRLNVIRDLFHQLN